MKKYKLIASLFVLIYFIVCLYRNTVPFMLVALILYFIINPPQKSKNFKAKSIQSDNFRTKEQKDILCVLLLVAIVPLIYMGIFTLSQGAGYIQKAYIIMTFISFGAWLLIDKKVSSQNIKIFPSQMPENFKNVVTIIFLCLLYAEFFTVDPTDSFLFFFGIVYVIINLLAYFISIVEWS